MEESSIKIERIIDRFDKYMIYKGLNDNKVTNQLGFSIGLLGKSRKEGRDLSKSAAEEILKFYTDIEKVWLLTGEGNMLKSTEFNEFNLEEPKDKYGHHCLECATKDKMITELWRKLQEKEKETCKVCIEKDKRIEYLEELVRCYSLRIDDKKQWVPEEKKNTG